MRHLHTALHHVPLSEGIFHIPCSTVHTIEQDVIDRSIYCFLSQLVVMVIMVLTGIVSAYFLWLLMAAVAAVCCAGCGAAGTRQDTQAGPGMHALPAQHTTRMQRDNV